MISIFLLLIIVHKVLVIEVSAHGRLIDPPSRASMWRFGFGTPENYNDHELYCGGFSRQWNRNSGKCGICGDPWDMLKPRPHENGGKYANNIIVRRYATGSVIPVRVELTANHNGYFEFRICPMTHRGIEVTQDCLDKNVLRGENGTTRYYPALGSGIFESYYKLPEGLTCTQCVFQWRYIAGNNWGKCENGTGAVGCGPQEEFRSCADIAISDDEKPLTPRPKTTTTTIASTKVTSTELPDFMPEYLSPMWLYSLIIAGTCLLVVLAAMALLYTYYYHADKAKKWLMTRKFLASKSPPVAPPRHKRNFSTAQLQL